MAERLRRFWLRDEHPEGKNMTNDAFVELLNEKIVRKDKNFNRPGGPHCYMASAIGGKLGALLTYRAATMPPVAKSPNLAPFNHLMNGHKNVNGNDLAAKRVLPDDEDAEESGNFEIVDDLRKKEYRTE